MAMAFNQTRGPISVAVDESRELIALYSPADQNRIQRHALQTALLNWRARFLSLRFSDAVRKQPLNYQWKQQGGTPLIRHGVMVRAVYKGRATASTRGGKLTGRLTLPPGHPLPTGRPGKGWPKNAKPTRYRNEIQRVLTSITPREVSFIAKQFTEAIVGITAAKEPVKRPSRRSYQPRAGQRKLTTAQRRGSF
jgi:hypothetical protein